MTAVMVSKWVGDFATHPLYHALLELKCIPFLEEEPPLTTPNEYLDTKEVKQIMASPAKSVAKSEQVRGNSARFAEIWFFWQHFVVLGVEYSAIVAGKRAFLLPRLERRRLLRRHWQK